ncbi:MAG: hypothetical protein AAGC74_04970 [Verrucomicrobiota bacterium]
MSKFVVLCFFLGLAIPLVGKFFWEGRDDVGDGEGLRGGEVRSGETAAKSRRFLEESGGGGRSVLELVRGEIRQFDLLEERDVQLENRIKLALFGLNERELGEVRGMIARTETLGRFYGIFMALYARWAEIDAEKAWEAAKGESLFVKAAREGVLLTWLKLDRERAMEELLKEKGEANLAILRRFSSILLESDPARAAELVDSLFEDWPEADAKIFPMVAKVWGQSEPVEAAEWIASHWDQETRNQLLSEIATNASKMSGRVGLEVVELIDDPEVRKEARWKAFEGWGHANGGKFSEDSEDASSSIASGIPTEWSEEDVRAFSQGFAKNFAHFTDDLIERAVTEEHRQAIFEGLIQGVMHSEPKLLVQAVENVSLDYLQSPNGRNEVTFFLRRWGEQSPAELDAWLGSQPEGPRRTEITHIVNSANLVSP